MTHRILSLLLLIALAPACAPASESPSSTEAALTDKPLVLLTDTAKWPQGALQHYRDSLQAAHYRVLVSGYPGESPGEISARLPWLLQPGVSLFIYDESLAGSTGADSLRVALRRLGQEIPVVVIRR